MNATDFAPGDWVRIARPLGSHQKLHADQTLMVVQIEDDGQIVVECEDEHFFVISPTRLAHA